MAMTGSPENKYILGGADGRTPVPEPDLFTWAEWWRDQGEGAIAEDTVGERRVVTAFHGINRTSAWPKAAPELFVTHIFGQRPKPALVWYATYDEALAGHAAVLAGLRS